MKKKILKGIAILLLAVLAVLLIGYIVMALWNNVLSPVLNVKEIDLKQAIGIFILAKILTGGFFRGHGGRGYWKDKISRKLANMPAEEREYYQKMYWKKCGFNNKPIGTENYSDEKVVETQSVN